MSCLVGDLHSKDKDKDLFIGQQEFVVGYSKAPEQPQSSALSVLVFIAPYTPKAVVIDYNHLPRQPLISSYVPD